jgi:hypothetical protein
MQAGMQMCRGRARYILTPVSFATAVVNRTRKQPPVICAATQQRRCRILVQRFPLLWPGITKAFMIFC